MLALVFDCLGGALVARYINNVWLLILASLSVGVLSSIAVNLILFFHGVYQACDAFKTIVLGVILHPIVSLVAAFVYRKIRLSRGSRLDIEPDQAERDRRRQLAIDAQNKMRVQKSE